MAIALRGYQAVTTNSHAAVTSVATSYTGWTTAAPQAGDLIVCVLLVTAASETITKSAGTGTWTIPASDSNSATDGFTSTTAYSIMASGDTAPTFAFGSASYSYIMFAFYSTAGGHLSVDTEATVKVDTTSLTHTANAASAAGSGECSIITGAARYQTSGSHAITVTKPTAWTAITSGGYAGASTFFSNDVNASYELGVGSGTVTPTATTYSLTVPANSYHLLVKETLPETAPGLELSSFGSFSGVTSGDTINYVKVDVTHKETSATDPAPTAQLWNGTTAQIGSTATLTSGTSLHDDSFQITGVTYSQLGTLQVRFYPSAFSGDGAHVDSVGLTVNYSIPPSVNGQTGIVPNIGVAANLVVPFNSVTGQTAFVWLVIPVGTSAQAWSENVSTAVTPVLGVTATVVVGSSAISGTAAFAATATLSAAASLALPGSATFAGTANLTAAGTVQLPGTSTFHGTATLSAAAAIVLPGTATLAGTATMSATAGALTIPGTAALSASANLGATGAVQISGTASLTGTAAMTASGVVVLGGAANFGAVAILSASGSIGGVIGGTASFSASASLTAAGTIYLPGSASLSASAVLSAPATVQLPGTASLQASAVLSAAAVVNLSGSAVFIANAILSASGSIGNALSGTATFTAAAQMSASASLILPGTAALNATAALSAAGYLGIPGTASFTANAVMMAAGYLNGVISGAAVFTANAVLQTNGVVILPATADFSATAELSTAGQVMLHGTAAFIANAVMTATGEFPGIATPGIVSVVFSQVTAVTAVFDQVTVVTATVDQVTSLKEA